MDAKDLYLQKTSSEAVLKDKAVMLFDSNGEPIAFDAKMLFNPQFKDLSMFDHQGASLLARCTANTYVVRTPGYYKFPFVYGNAVKNGAANTEAYTNVGGSTCANFVNHLGVPITSPYLEGNANCKPTSVEVTFQTSAGLILGLEAVAGGDCGYARFRVESIPDNGAYAVISAKNSGGQVIWSWTIWCYKDDLTDIEFTNYQGVRYSMMPVNLCTIKSSSAPTFRNAHYQWGRKDPIPHVTVYGADGNSKSLIISTTPAGDIKDGILNPFTFFCQDANNNNDWQSAVTSRYNHWDAAKTAAGATDSNTKKTVYDPCPVGFKVPNARVYTGFTTTGGNTSDSSQFNVVGNWSSGWNFKRNANDAAGNYFPASGFRDHESGALSGMGSGGYYWSSAPSSAANAYGLDFYSGNVYPLDSGSRAYGFSVRPVRE